MSQAKSTNAAGETAKGFTDEEKAAMQERAKELKAEARANKDRAAGEGDLLAKIAEMPEPTSSHEKCRKTQRRPQVGCTQCWARLG